MKWLEAACAWTGFMQVHRVVHRPGASVMTGRTNDRTGVFAVGDSINKQEKMLSTAFQKAGYTTGHFGKWHLNTVSTPEDSPLPLDDPHNPGELGFDYWLSGTISSISIPC